jgi:hypothetical protein
MSLTEPAAHEASARKFFQQRLLPVAQRVRERGVALFPAGPEPSKASYYEPRDRRPLTPEDFEVPTMQQPEQLAEALASLWRGQHMPELAEQAPAFVELARSLRQVEAQSAEVSPFVYVMF